MTKLYKILLFLWVSAFALPLYAQNTTVTVTGTLTDKKGEPIIGATILVERTRKGCTTDIDGNYRFTAQAGDIVNISYVGYEKRSLIVTKEGTLRLPTRSELPYTISTFSTNKNAKDYVRFLEDTTKSIDGLGVFRRTTPSYKYTNDANYQTPIYRIRVTKDGTLQLRTKPYRFNDRKKFQVAFENQVLLSAPNRLPTLQNTYTQGRPLNGTNTWQGAETGEIFSWGARRQDVRYTQTAYPYDANGALSTSGVGKTAETYNPYDFLQTGVSNAQTIEAQLRSKNYYQYGNNKKFFTKIRYERIQDKGVIPTAQHLSDFVSFHTSYDRKYWTHKVWVNYKNASSILPERGNSWQQIFGSVVRTPPTFDNANAQKRKDAVGKTNTYLLPDNTLRSHSPNQVFNPFQLINVLPDQSQRKNWGASANSYYYNDDTFIRSFWTYLHYSRQENRNIFATSSLPAVIDRRTDRRQNTDNLSLRLSAKTQKIEGLEIGTSYHIDYTQNNLRRIDALPSTSEKITQNTLNRWVHKPEISLSHNDYYSNYIGFLVSNSFYLSSTSPKSYFFLPDAKLNLDLKRIADNWWNWYISGGFLSTLDFAAKYTKSVRETPLIYNDWSYNTLAYQSTDYARYFENSEVFWRQGILPEVYSNWRFVLAGGFFRDKLSFKADFYNEITDNYLAPILQNNGSFLLENAGKIRNRGIELSLGFKLHQNVNWRQLNFETTFTAHFYRPVVLSLNPNLGKDRIALAGYEDISTNMIAGQPLGVIVGSTYLRNAQGEVVIDNQGFPKVAASPSILGNPNPDAILTWSNALFYKNVSFWFSFDYRIGGEIWNGTHNALNYLGRSQESADLRNTTGYVFQGVNEAGLPNQIPVSFANPQASVQENRWVRYGFTGVGEEAIQKATSLRLSNLEIKYDLSNWFEKRYIATDISISAYIQNVLLYTPYKGIDPLTNLMGYTRANGLDLFNFPALRTFGFRLKMKV